MTIKQLRRLIKGLPPRTEVVFNYRDGEDEIGILSGYANKEISTIGHIQAKLEPKKRPGIIILKAAAIYSQISDDDPEEIDWEY